jgi:hypothetical protein
MLAGTVTLPKDLLDADYLHDRAYDRRSALTYLWLKANDRDREITLQGQTIPLKRGQLARSMVTLAREWQKDRHTVKGILDLLRDRGRINFRTTNTCVIITVLDYIDYNPDTAAESTTDSPAHSPAESTTDSPAKPPSNSPQKVEGRRIEVEGGSATPPGALVPGDNEVRAFCASWPGEMALGIPAGIPEGWWSGWLAARMTSGRPFPRDWKRVLILAFRGDWINQHPKTRPSSPDTGRPNNLGNEKKRGTMSPAQELFLLRRQLEELQADLEARHLLAQPITPEARLAQRDLQKKIAALENPNDPSSAPTPSKP